MTKPNSDSLFGALLALRGNPRACTYTEPLWGIPFNLYIPYFTLYMFTMGLDDRQIGFILSMGLFLNMFSSLLGGVLTDKFGRRRTTLWGDILSWTIPCLIWAFAQNFYWFVAAAFINGLDHITTNSWQCLLVEDAEPDQLVSIYTWMYIAGLIAVFFAPISGYFIGRHSLIPVMRVLFLISALMMTLKFVILYRYSTETAQGKIRLEETRGVSLFRLVAEYKDVLAAIFKTPATVRMLAIISLCGIQQLISGNFFSLYVTQNLHTPDQYLAVFTIVRAAIMLAFFFLAQNYLAKLPVPAVMLAGLGLYAGGHVLLLAAPPDALALLVVYTAVDACAAALFLPRRDALLMQRIDPKERPRIMSLLTIITLGVTSPFGFAAGVLSEINRRLPFMINLVLFALIGALIALERKGKQASENEREDCS